MIALLSASWGIVLRRGRADWAILTAAGITILLATTLLAAGPIYTDAVTLSGLRQTLRSAPVREANIAVGASLSGRNYAASDRAVTARLVEAVEPVGATIVRRGRSESFALPGQTAEVRDLAVFAFIEGIERHATLSAGTWPAASAEPYEVALPATTAASRQYRVGDEVRLTSRLMPDWQPSVRIVGLYQVNDPADPFWFGDALEIDGREDSPSFTTYGPFVVPQATLLGPLSQTPVHLTWYAYPDVERLTAAVLPRLTRQLLQLPVRASASLPNSTVQVDTRLPAILDTAQRSLLVTRSGVLIQLVQLAILAGYALVLTTGLLVEQRRNEALLFHSRGASPGQVLTLAILEGLLLALPAALLGPWLAAFGLRLLGVAGPLASLSSRLSPQVNQAAYLLAGGAALACVALLALPALGAARSLTEVRADRSRQGARGLAQRAGLDLALLVAAALAYTQLRRYGTPLTRTLQGQLGVDPLLVAAPGLGLLAGAVIALRLLPLVARLAERAAANGRATAPALGAWQIARRPQRYARSALLLILALGIGLYAAAYTRTWTASQADQADFAVGADIRAAPDLRTGTSVPALMRTSLLRQLGDVRTAMPVIRDREEFARGAGIGDLILLDSQQAAAAVRFRPDLAAEPLPALLDRLARGRPDLQALPLPGEPQRLALDLRATRQARATGTAEPTALTATLVLQDGEGVLFRLPPARLRGDGQVERVITPLTWPLSDGRFARPVYPLALVSIELGAIVSRVEDHAQVDLLGLHASDSASGETWGDLPLPPDPGSWTIGQADLAIANRPPAIESAPVASGAILSVRLATGTTTQPTAGFPITFGLRPGPLPPPTIVPVLVDERLLRQTGTQIGDTLEIAIGGAGRRAQIVGTLRGFPTVPPGGGTFMVADLPTIAALQSLPGAAIMEPTEYWLTVAPGRAEAVAEALRRAPYYSPSVLSRAEQTTLLRTNPLALGTIGALALGFVTATFIAILGFAVSAAAAARERLAEFALLRALGLHPRQLVAWLSLEQGFTVGLGLLGGLLLGLLLTRLILPLVTLTQAGTAATPPVQIIVPWLTVTLLAAGILIALVGVAAVLAVLLRRQGLTALLRTGEG